MHISVRANQGANTLRASHLPLEDRESGKRLAAERSISRLYLICLAKLLKALVRLLITRVLVRVKLPGQHIVCPLHLLWRSILHNAGSE